MMIYDNHHDRVYRQWVFLQTVKIGLFTLFAAANGTLLSLYAAALPQIKAQQVHTLIGSHVRHAVGVVSVDPRTALFVSLVAMCIACLVLWVHNMLEKLIRGRVTRGTYLESQLEIPNGFFAEIDQRMHSRGTFFANVPVIMGTVIIGVLVIWFGLVAWAYTHLPT